MKTKPLKRPDTGKPRRSLRDSPENWERQERAAKIAGRKDWSEWARDVLNTEAFNRAGMVRRKGFR